jgi:H+/Cl- antiporter ClcA
MGLQYFEALSPATVSSIVAVLTNRMVVGNDVTGYYSYPFLTATLPSEIFTSAIVYGLWGAAMGIVYAVGCKKLKGLVHELFHEDEAKSTSPVKRDLTHREHVNKSSTEIGEQMPLLVLREKGKKGPGLPSLFLPSFRAVILRWLRKEPALNALRGALAGSLVGCLCMFLPHVMFWGEAQLQTLIDKGRTPLPVFGIGDEPTSALVALGRCMVDPNDELAVKNGFGLECSFFISVAKIVTTGLSLGTGIVGGHFWGPLFVGCSSGHFLTQAVRMFSEKTGYGATLAQYPCVVILCVMGSAHVVTYRAHMAIVSAYGYLPSNDDVLDDLSDSRLLFHADAHSDTNHQCFQP